MRIIAADVFGKLTCGPADSSVTLAIPALAKCLEHDKRDVRIAAARALQRPLASDSQFKISINVSVDFNGDFGVLRTCVHA